MDGEKPLISILMSVYEPKLDWLREQLASLEAQSYPRLRLYVRDDCSPGVPFETVCSLVRETIKSFPFTLNRNEENLGSNRTFERLTQEADGDLFAYCDQDDVWMPEKLEVLEDAMLRSGALLACSDMAVIDSVGNRIADSITEVRPKQRFQSGEALAERLVYENFITGCAMLVKAEAAKAAVPFCPYMVHDNYIGLCCAARGRIESVLQPLLSYRLHGENQSRPMAGICDRESYCRMRIELVINKLEWLRAHFKAGPEVQGRIEGMLLWMKARRARFRGDKKACVTIWKYRRYGPKTSFFELIAPALPEGLFMWIVFRWGRDRV